MYGSQYMTNSSNLIDCYWLQSFSLQNILKIKKHLVSNHLVSKP